MADFVLAVVGKGIWWPAVIRSENKDFYCVFDEAQQMVLDLLGTEGKWLLVNRDDIEKSWKYGNANSFDTAQEIPSDHLMNYNLAVSVWRDRFRQLENLPNVAEHGLSRKRKSDDTDSIDQTACLQSIDLQQQRDIRVKKRYDVISWDDYFMSVAFLSAMRSKDPSTQVGACIVNKDKRYLKFDLPL